MMSALKHRLLPPEADPVRVQHGAIGGSDEALLEFLGFAAQHRRCNKLDRPRILQEMRRAHGSNSSRHCPANGRPVGHANVEMSYVFTSAK